MADRQEEAGVTGVVLAVLLTLTCGVPAHAAASAAARHEAAAEKLFKLASAEKYTELDGLLDATMRKAFTLEMRKATFDGLMEQYGEVAGFGKARGTPTAVIPVRFKRGVLDIRLTLNADGTISGLFFQPHAAEIPAPDAHETELLPPFKGRWLTFWGGGAREQNAHIDHPNQRHAFDFLGLGPDGNTKKGGGAANEDYYAFGRDILAPADGTVTDVITGVRDNAPGSMNQYSALGNAVLIRHREHEVSVLAHLKQGSVRVKAGDVVRRGDVLGQCGNSGNSSEPHLHYHLQNTPVVQDGTGIKVFFSGLGPERLSPVKGDILDAP